MSRTMARAVRLAIGVAGLALVGWALVGWDPHWAERHVLASYCATGAPVRVMARALRWGAAALGAFALAVLAPAAARRVERASLRGMAGPLAGIALAVAASLSVSELVMRRLHDRLALGARPAPADAHAPMTRVDPRLGWSYFPGRTTWVEMGGRRFSYAIDSAGDRVASISDRPDPARSTVLFAGESIVFGYGLPYEETFPFLVGRDLPVEAVNLGVIGYGTDQAHLRVLDALERHRPLAVVTLFIPSQLRRNVDVWRPRLALGPGGELELVPPSSGPRIAKLLQVLPYHDDEALRVTAATLRATSEAARAHGALPLFVVTNYGAACLRDDGEEPWIVEELFRRQGLPFVRVDLEPEDLLAGLFERHPSLRGTTKIAAAVVRALSERLASMDSAVTAPSPSAGSRPAGDGSVLDRSTPRP